MLALLALAASLAPAPAAAARGTCPGAELRPADSDQHALAVATLCLIDRIRAGHGLARLRSNHQLAHAASREARQLVALDYFSDVSPTGVTARSMIAAARYVGRSQGFAYGQNLAWGTEARATPSEIVAAWMASPRHRAIILTPMFRDAGVAVLARVPAIKAHGRAGATYAMEFGRR